MMTDERYEELGGIILWYWTMVRVVEAKLQIGAADGYHEDDIMKANAARVVLGMWKAEKEKEIGVTQEEWDEYECRQEGEVEAVEGRREEDMK